MRAPGLRASLAVSSGSMPKRFVREGELCSSFAAEHLVAGLHVGEVQVR